MFSQPCQFTASADRLSALPEEGPPEIAFAGRSNAGKSSLLNALVQQKNLARSGGRPGLTRALIFFTLANGIRLVDLPGYGYSEARPEIMNKNRSITQVFLKKRRTIRIVCLLVDIRRTIMKNDEAMIEQIIDTGNDGLVIATKIDKLPLAMQAQQLQKIGHFLKIAAPSFPAPLPTSALKGSGIDRVRKFLEHSLNA